jgi:hypothetical protein
LTIGDGAVQLLCRRATHGSLVERYATNFES